MEVVPNHFVVRIMVDFQSLNFLNYNIPELNLNQYYSWA